MIEFFLNLGLKVSLFGALLFLLGFLAYIVESRGKHPSFVLEAASRLLYVVGMFSVLLGVSVVAAAGLGSALT